MWGGCGVGVGGLFVNVLGTNDRMIKYIIVGKLPKRIGCEVVCVGVDGGGRGETYIRQRDWWGKSSQSCGVPEPKSYQVGLCGEIKWLRDKKGERKGWDD